ncbi:MAG: HPr family phosphocarrier protein [Hellea sp.]|nr:HPr family phosphocarrier protein [Hellea sp.]
MQTYASATVQLTNKRGLHARASHKFVARALEFESQIEVKSHNSVCAETVVADSVMELLLLGSACGEDITISARGKDAKKAVSSLITLVKNRFGEED